MSDLSEMTPERRERVLRKRSAIIGEPAVVRRMSRRTSLQKVTSNGTIAAAVMVAAALLAVIVANSPAYEAVEHVLQAPLSITIGGLVASMSVEAFVNDFLMSIFFLLVGIELKYEMTVGQLRKPRQAALPMLAAVGGVAFPAIIYLLFRTGYQPNKDTRHLTSVAAAAR